MEADCSPKTRCLLARACSTCFSKVKQSYICSGTGTGASRRIVSSERTVKGRSVSARASSSAFAPPLISASMSLKWCASLAVVKSETDLSPGNSAPMWAPASVAKVTSFMPLCRLRLGTFDFYAQPDQDTGDHVVRGDNHHKLEYLCGIRKALLHCGQCGRTDSYVAGALQCKIQHGALGGAEQRVILRRKGHITQRGYLRLCCPRLGQRSAMI